VLADDPRLTVRLVAGPDPQPLVVDSHQRIPRQAQVLRHPKGVWIATVDGEQRANASEPLGSSARILAVGAGPDGRVDLQALLAELGRRGIRSVMVEGGAQILTSFMQEQLAQAAVITIAPRFLGGVAAISAPMAARGFTPHLASVAYTPAGEDLVVWGEFVSPEMAQVNQAVQPSPQKRTRG
jgi:riboflavin-specific deaminase-like protein